MMDTKYLIEWLGDRLDKLDGKMDAMATASATVKATLAEHEADIKELRADVDPLKAKMQQAQGIAWVVGVVGAAVGVFATVWQLLA